MALFSKNIVGLEINSACVRAVELSKSTINPKFISAGSIPLPEGVVKDGSIEQTDIVVNAIKELWRKADIKTKDVLLGVNNQYVIVRIANMPKTEPDQRDKTIRFQAQEFLPVSLDSVEVDYLVIEEEDPENQGQMKVMIVAGGKRMINEHIQVIEKAGLRINDIDVSILALTKILSPMQKGGTSIVLNLSKEISSILILTKGIPVLARNLNANLTEYTDKEVHNLTKEQIDNLTELVSREIISSVNYYNTNYPESNIRNIYLSGLFCDSKEFIKIIKEKLDITLSVINPFSMLNGEKTKISKVKSPGEYGVAIGLAIRGLEG